MTNSLTLGELIERDGEFTERIARLQNRRDQGRDLLIGLARKWVQLYGQMAPRQTIGSCTACFLTMDDSESIQVAMANTSRHRPLADQECLVFTVACSYCGDGGCVWVPTAWIQTQLTAEEHNADPK